MGQFTSKVQAALDQVKDRLDLSKGGIANEISDILTRDVQTTLASQRGPDGENWPELSEAYGAWKEAHYPGNPMAVLHRAMGSETQIRGTVIVTPDCITIVYGTDPEVQAYAHAFHFGEPSHNQPARPFFGASPTAIREMIRVVKQHTGAR